MAEEREIEVRTLSRESTRVSIMADKSIGSLKLLLARSFPPASFSPNFHLFFKGVKLTLQDQIGSLTIEPGEFLVLVPFVKKERPPPSNPDFLTDFPKQSSNSSYADSVYSDMMQEFSSFLEESSNTSIPPNHKANNTSFGYKRKRDFNSNDDNHKEGDPYAFLWSVLQSPNKNLFEDRNCKKFVGILESLNCLTSPHSGTCVLLANWANYDIAIHRDDRVSRLCPAWLKRLVQAFAFLNIFSAHLQM